MSKEDRKKRRKRRKEIRRSARPALWEECRAKFSLSDEDIRKAKELGLTPEYLISLPVRPSEKWKKSPRIWINDLYKKRIERLAKKARAKARWERRNNVL